MRRRRLILSVLVLSFLRGTGQAAGLAFSDVAGRYVISAESSKLAFSVPQMGGGGIAGRFTRFDGTITIDAADVSRSSVAITIVPDSVVTGKPRVDAFLKSDAVFDAAHETAISFRSTAVERTGPQTAIIKGVLTARGRTHPAIFQAELDDLGKGRVGFHVQGRVLRSFYGMDVGTPIYSNIVDFDMYLQAVKQ